MVIIRRMKYGCVAVVICVCALYQILLSCSPRLFEKSGGADSVSVVVYDGRFSGCDFQIRVTDGKTIEILYESGKSTVSLSALSYTDLDGHFIYAVPSADSDPKTFRFDVRPTDGKCVYADGVPARTLHLYYKADKRDGSPSKANLKEQNYNFDFWCVVSQQNKKPKITVR